MRTPPPRRRGLEYLLTHMPAHDLRTMPADLLEENVACAYRALARAPWRERIDEALFLDEILPSCVLTEQRDAWRPAMEARCRPLIEGITSPGAAAVALNQRLFPLIKLRYSRHRPLVDPSPSQALESGLASCTGLSIVLVAACRSVAIPARFVGIPAWPGDTGNHSWVEVWDDGWHFTGAAEPAGDRLDEAWFTGRAAGALRDDPRHAIHAAGFTRRPDRFPLPWPEDADIRTWSINVTDRYSRRTDPPPKGRVRMLLRVRAAPQGDRVAADFVVCNATGASLASGRTRDERFKVHEDVTVVLPRDAEATVRLSWRGREWTETIRPTRDSARHELPVPPAAAAGP